MDFGEGYNEAIVLQQNQISSEIIASQAVIAEKEKLSNLMGQYDGDEVFQGKIKKLQEKYSFIRRTRGDGNCFYRAFGFAYFELLIEDKDELNRFRSDAEKGKGDLLAQGFPQSTVEDFYAEFVEVLDKIGAGCTTVELLKIFNEQDVSDCIVVFLRLLVSGYLQKNAEFFSGFIDDSRTMKDFCFEEVEPMGKECDHVQITALSSSTLVPIRVEYMDRGSTSDHIDFPEASTPAIFLLYRPGHYDILYA